MYAGVITLPPTETSSPDIWPHTCASSIQSGRHLKNCSAQTQTDYRHKIESYRIRSGITFPASLQTFLCCACGTGLSEGNWGTCPKNACMGRENVLPTHVQ